MISWEIEYILACRNKDGVTWWMYYFLHFILKIYFEFKPIPALIKKFLFRAPNMKPILYVRFAHALLCL
jgi:hypothetical protein